MSLAALAGLLVVLFVKRAGLRIPVPGDLLVVGAGVAWSGAGSAAAAGLLAIPAARFLDPSRNGLAMVQPQGRARAAAVSRETPLRPGRFPHTLRSTEGGKGAPGLPPARRPQHGRPPSRRA